MSVIYSQLIYKKIQKHKLPYHVWQDMRDAFDALAATKNFRLFDIKKMVVKGSYVYYRLRIRNYRALFYFDQNTIIVQDIGPRGGVYKP